MYIFNNGPVSEILHSAGCPDIMLKLLCTSISDIYVLIYAMVGILTVNKHDNNWILIQ